MKGRDRNDLRAAISNLQEIHNGLFKYMHLHDVTGIPMETLRGFAMTASDIRSDLMRILDNANQEPPERPKLDLVNAMELAVRGELTITHDQGKTTIIVGK